MPNTNSNSLRIAICCNSAFGVANFRSGLISQLLAHGHRVAVIAPADANFSTRLQEMGAEFIDWSVSGRGSNPWRELRAFLAMFRIYRDFRPDVVLNYTIKPVIYGALAARLVRARCVSVITGLGYVFLNNTVTSRCARWLYARTLSLSTEVWFLNGDDQKWFEQLKLVDRVPVRLLPSEGIDTTHFSVVDLPQGDGDRTVLLIGRLLRDKGVLEFVEAARLLSRKHAHLRFLLIGAAGSDNPSAVSRSEVDAWVKEGVIEYQEAVQDVRPAIAQSHCVVLPSYREGVPRTLLEAAAMARPLVATDVPGCREVVIDGVTGLLCKPRDPLDLASKIESVILKPPSELFAMGMRGRAYVQEHFEESVVVAQYLDFLAGRGECPAMGRVAASKVPGDSP